MAEPHTLQVPPEAQGAIAHHLASLKLAFIAEQYATVAKQAADKAWSHVEYLGTLLAGEAGGTIVPPRAVCGGRAFPS